MAKVVYVLCALTSALCAVLLLRAWASSRTRLLFWSGLCFCGLAINNILLVVDRAIVTGTDLSVVRSGSGLLSVSLLLYGLIWESSR